MVTMRQNSKKKYPVHSTRSSRLLSTKSVKQWPVPAVASATSATKKKMKPATPNEKCPSPSSKNRQELQAFSRSIQKQNHFTFSFNAELQDGDAEPQGQNCLPFRACFYARGVSALIAPTSMMNAGRNVVDRGHLLIQRELETDYLRHSFFPHEATSEHNKPALVLPVGFIALVEMGKVVGGVQHHPKGHIKLYTHCTLTPVSCMEPQLVTLYMSAEDMDAFNMALGIASKKYPCQNLFFKQQGDA